MFLDLKFGKRHSRGTSTLRAGKWNAEEGAAGCFQLGTDTLAILDLMGVHKNIEINNKKKQKQIKCYTLL
jgi:hypothetical protein